MDTLPLWSQEDNTPKKLCTACGKNFPATHEFFSHDKRGKNGLASQCKSCMRTKAKARYHRPDVHEKALASQKEYRTRPENKERMRAYKEEYYSRPENRAQKNHYDKEYRQRPEIRQRSRLYSTSYARQYRQRPGVREHIRNYEKSPQVREHKRSYQNRPEVRERHRLYHRSYRRIHRERFRLYHALRSLRPDVQEKKRLRTKDYESRPLVRAQKRIRKHARRARAKSVSGASTSQQIQALLKQQRYRCYYCQQHFAKRTGQYVYHVDHTFPLSRVVGTDIPANDISYLVLACPRCNLSKGDKFPWEWSEGGRLL